MERVLNKFGYYKAIMPQGPAVTASEMEELWEWMAGNEVLLRMLRDMSAKDIKLYFQATTEQDRNLVRGAHARTNYFISLIRKVYERRNKAAGRTDRGRNAV